MDELKYAILVAATVLATRKLNEIGSTPCPAPECAISDAFSVQRQIDSQEDWRWPAARRRRADCVFGLDQERPTPTL